MFVAGSATTVPFILAGTLLIPVAGTRGLFVKLEQGQHLILEGVTHTACFPMVSSTVFRRRARRKNLTAQRMFHTAPQEFPATATQRSQCTKFFYCTRKD